MASRLSTCSVRGSCARNSTVPTPTRQMRATTGHLRPPIRSRRPVAAATEDETARTDPRHWAPFDAAGRRRVTQVHGTPAASRPRSLAPFPSGEPALEIALPCSRGHRGIASRVTYRPRPTRLGTRHAYGRGARTATSLQRDFNPHAYRAAPSRPARGTPSTNGAERLDPARHALAVSNRVSEGSRPTRRAAMGVSRKSRRRERGVHEPTSAPLRTGESRASAQSARTEPSISSGSSAEASTPLHAIGKRS